ncbi:hypothetical protein [Lactobacillus phage LL-H]|uniref:hypothetical protein n=1 Tax=Lactococcus phage LL-H TaxID=12348 RepID=UPI000009B494|nr:hypothetical protein LPLLH_ORF205 [Lactobacillus phage LL-H]AAL77553.1 hypothetical protein [Lactobacillus phage LL-H]
MRRLTKGCVGYQLIDQIIADYGSLIAAPDEAFTALHDWLEVGRVGDIEVEETDTPAVRLAKKKAEGLNMKLDTMNDLLTLKWLFEYGYSNPEISRWTGIGKGVLVNRRNSLGIKTRKEFTYLIKKVKRKYYVTSPTAAGEALGIPHGDGSVYVRLEKKGYVLEELHQIHFGDLPEGAIYITSNGIFKKGESNGDYESADVAVSRD